MGSLPGFHPEARLVIYVHGVEVPSVQDVRSERAHRAALAGQVVALDIRTVYSEHSQQPPCLDQGTKRIRTRESTSSPSDQADVQNAYLSWFITYSTFTVMLCT
jgi:hypothetical protein